MSRLMTKPTKLPKRPAKTKTKSPGICWVWSVFAVRLKKHWALKYLLSTHWRVWRLWSDWGMPRLIWVFAWRMSFCWFCRVAAQIARCPVFESWSGYVLFPPVTFGGLCVCVWGGGSVLGFRAAKGLSRQFQVDLVTNIIKQGETVTERHCC